MAILDCIIFGYRTVSVEPGDIPKLAGILMRLGISSDISPAGVFLIKNRDFKRFTAYANGRIRYGAGSMRGIPAFFLSYKHRYGVMLGIICMVILYVFLSSMVWDIRIDGNNTLSCDDIKNELKNCGFETGARWYKIDKNEVETDVLATNNKISWISINRRGTVAYVEILESENIGIKEEEAPKYSNIVADRDAVIEEISVKKGKAMVKVGDVVKKGDLLISGVVENEYGNLLCRAEGTVKAKAVAVECAEVDRLYSEKNHEKTVLHEIFLNIFGKIINIFKNYGNLPNNCDIIETEEEYVFSNGAKLPLTFTITKREIYTLNELEYSDAELVIKAGETMTDRISVNYASSDILKIKTSGNYTETGYRMISEILYSSNIGAEREIEVSD